jgi:toxin ParE1/3/4
LRPVEWSPRALHDLFDIYDYIALDNPEAAARVVDRIRSTGKLLGSQALLGRASRFRNRRELIVDQYVLTYQVKREGIWILSVVHGMRRR